MNLADRIQALRKGQGISQEELADRLGVSRQAVSKWESEQSTPDVEKIIHLGECFGVTTDYLLRGIEPSPPAQPRRQPAAGVFAAAGTALNAAGLLICTILWYDRQSAVAFAGAVMMIMGCMIYAVGQASADPATKPAAKRQFWSFNIWILPFVPLSVLVNILTWGRYGRVKLAPYPTFITDGVAVFALLYLLAGIAGTWYIRRRWKKEV